MIYFIIFFLIIIYYIWILTAQFELKIVLENRQSYAFVIFRILKGIIKLRYNLQIEPGDKSIINVHIRKTDKELEKSKGLSQTIENIKKWNRLYKLYKDTVKYLINKMNVILIKMDCKVGFKNDAALTALLAGSTASAAQAFIGYIRLIKKIDSVKINVKPDYSNDIININFDCIIDLKIGHIIIAGCKAILQKIKKSE